MKKYRIEWEQKDYGGGGACYRTLVDAEDEEQAVRVLRDTKCGVEEIFEVKEVA